MAVAGRESGTELAGDVIDSTLGFFGGGVSTEGGGGRRRREIRERDLEWVSEDSIRNYTTY